MEQLEQIWVGVLISIGIVLVVTIYILKIKKTATAPIKKFPNEVPAASNIAEQKNVIETSNEKPESVDDIQGDLSSTTTLTQGSDDYEGNNARKEHGRKHREKKPPPKWMEDFEAPNCLRCNSEFSFLNRRHHCRMCRKIFCGPCSSREIKGQRTCENCFSYKKERQQRKLDKNRTNSYLQSGNGNQNNDRAMNVNVNMNINFNNNNIGQWYKTHVASEGVGETDEKLFEWAQKQLARKENVMIIPSKSSLAAPLSPITTTTTIETTSTISDPEVSSSSSSSSSSTSISS